MWALAGLAAVEAIIIASLVRTLAGRRRREAAARFPAGADDPGNLAALYAKALTGSLDRFPVTQVLQFLNSIRETGILDIVDDRVSAVHRLLLEDGEIIDAYNGQQRAEEAVREILQCREGSFTFLRGDLPSAERTVGKPTMTLLMEACQFEDESGGG